MAKRIVEKEVVVCDLCGEETYDTHCLHCGKHYCYDCRKSKAVEYQAGVHHWGYGDGLYCTECDRRLEASRADSLHQAYRAIQALRVEHAEYYEDFQRRRLMAEAEAEKLFGARHGRR